MKRFKKLLVATDTRLDEHPVVNEAADVAAENQAALMIVDVVPIPSWVASKLTSDLDHLHDLFVQEAESKLESLAQPLREKGIDVTTQVLRGKTSIEIIREAIRGNHDLVLAVAKGNASKRQGFFGYTAVHLLKACPCAVWLVTDEAATKVKHVLGCVDVSSEHEEDAELDRKVYEVSSSIAELQGAKHSVLHAWRMHDEALISKRLGPKAVADLVRMDREYTTKRYNEFLAQYESSVESQDVHLIKGRAPETIQAFVQEQTVDLVVMGTVSRSGLSGMLIGNTAEQILDRIECSVLALKPDGFRSPIKLK